MPEDPTFRWQQVVLGNHVHDQWFANLAAPFRSAIFAGVGRALDGNWLIELSPRGHGLGQPIIAVKNYRSLEKAKAHVERWALSHWRGFPRESSRDLGNHQ